MLNKEQIEVFLGKYVSIGVQHLVESSKLFFYYGTLIKVDDEILTLRTNTGFKIVPLNQVLDIHTDNWRQP
ncbi:MAG: hypothetical protein H7836_14585 [Magnetococcus sp. YQC-3]